LHGNPPVEWGEGRNLSWKVEVPGEGFSTPIVWGDRLFLLSAVPQGERDRPTFDFTVLCYHRESGKQLWRRVVRTARPHEGRHNTNSYASGSPVTDGRLLWASFGSFGLYALDFEGQVVWEKQLGPMRTRNEFGEASTPAVHGDTLVLVRDTEEDSALFAFHARTGEERWRQAREERTSWTTPRILEHRGRLQVVVNGTTAVRAYDLATGEVLWTCSGQTMNAVPSLVADADTVYAMSGFRGNAAQAIALGRSGDLTGTDAVRWSLNRGTPYVPSPLLVDGLLFFLQLHSGIFSCVDARSGRVHYLQERLPGLTSAYASPVAAAGRLYLAGRDGVVLVLKQAPALEVLATNRHQDAFNASPVVVGDALYLRGQSHLYRIAAP
jgi:outer membrane protein assembly factor BamB